MIKIIPIYIKEALWSLTFYLRASILSLKGDHLVKSCYLNNWGGGGGGGSQANKGNTGHQNIVMLMVAKLKFMNYYGKYAPD